MEAFEVHTVPNAGLYNVFVQSVFFEIIIGAGFVAQYIASHESFYLWFGVVALILVPCIFWFVFAIQDKKLYAGSNGLRVKISNDGIWFGGLASPIAWSRVASAGVETRVFDRRRSVLFLVVKLKDADESEYRLDAIDRTAEEITAAISRYLPK